MVGFIEELQDFGSRLPLKLNLAQLFETLKLASNAKKKKDVWKKFSSVFELAKETQKLNCSQFYFAIGKCLNSVTES